LTDSDEDVVLEVLDFVTGWCSPYARLKRGSESHIADSRSTLKRITSRLLAQARAAHCVTGESNRQQGVGKSGCPVLATSTALRDLWAEPCFAVAEGRDSRLALGAGSSRPDDSALSATKKKRC